MKYVGLVFTWNTSDHHFIVTDCNNPDSSDAGQNFRLSAGSR